VLTNFFSLSRNAKESENTDLWPMTLKINRVRAVVKVHVPAKFHQAQCSGSRVNLRTQKKNSDENNTVRRYRTNSKNVRSVSTHLRLVRAFGVLGKFAVVVKDERNVVLGRRTTCRRAADIATTTTTTTCQTTASTAGARHTTTASTSSGQWPNGWVGIVDIQRRRLALEPNVVSVLATT